MPQEKRKDKRVKEDFSILCKIFRKTTISGNVSRIIDISLSGMAFVTDNPLTQDDILEIIFRIPPSFKEKVELFGRVIDCRPGKESNFKTRVIFIDISERAKTLLAHLIEQTKS